MSVYSVELDDGTEFRVEAAPEATSEELLQLIRQGKGLEMSGKLPKRKPVEEFVEDEQPKQKSSRREELQRRYEQRLAEIPEPTPVFEEEPSTFENLRKGFGTGFISTGESAALGLATLLEEEQELRARDSIKATADALKPKGGGQDDISYKIGQTFGSIAGFAAPLVGIATLPVSAPTVTAAGIGAGAALGIGAQAGEASERARAAGATEEERNRAIRQAAPFGALEALPIARFARPYLGKLIGDVGEEAVTGLKNRMKSAAGAGGVEAAQEVATEFVQNLAERGYNPDRELFAGLAEPAAYGGGAGATIQLLMDAFVGRRGPRGPSADPAQEDTGTPALEAQEATPTLPRQGPIPQRQGPLPALIGPVPPRQGPIPQRQGPLPALIGPVPQRQGPLPERQGPIPQRQGPLPALIGPVPPRQGPQLPERQGPPLPVQGPPEMQGPRMPARQGPPEMQGPPSPAKERLTKLFGAPINKMGPAREGTPAGSKVTKEVLRDLKIGPKTKLYKDLLNKDAGDPEVVTLLQERLGKIKNPENRKKAAILTDVFLARARKGPIAAGIRPVAGKKPEAEAAPETSPEYQSSVAQDKLDAAFAQRMAVDPELAYLKEEAGIDTQGGDVRTIRGKRYNKDTKQEEVVDVALGADVDRTTPADREAVAQLLDRKLSKGGKKDTDARAAQAFFKRYRRPSDALETIGAAIASKNKQKPSRVVSFKTLEGKVEQEPAYASDAEYKFYADVNTVGMGEAAQRWVQANMGAEAVSYIKQGINKMSKGTPLDKQGVATRVAAKAKEVESDETKALNKQIKDAVEAAERAAVADKATTAPAEVTAKGKSDVDAARERATTSKAQAVVDRKFEAYAKEQELDLDAMSDAEVLALREAFETNVDIKRGAKDIRDLQAQDPYAGMYAAFDLPRNDVVALARPLSASVKKAVRADKLEDALNNMAGSPAVRALAKKMATAVGTTKVKVVKDLRGSADMPAAGTFDPQTNTISLDSKAGLNNHVLLHEMGHAVASASLANKNAGTTKSLTRLYEAVREQIGGMYGTTSVDEFLSEALSNPEFRSVLSTLQIKDVKFRTAYDKLADILSTLWRRLLGYPREKTVADRVDALFDNIMAPAPKYRNGPTYNMLASTPEGSEALIKSILDNKTSGTPPTIQKIQDSANDTKSSVGNKLFNFMASFLDSRILTDIASSKIPFAKDLHNLILKQTGELRNRLERIDSLTGRIQKYRRENNAGYKLLDYLTSTSTFLQVDPSVPRSTYDSYRLSYANTETGKTTFQEYKTKDERDAKIKSLNANIPANRTKARAAGNPDPDKMADWDKLNAVYESKEVGDAGRDLYRTTRNFFQEIYDEIPAALEARINAVSVGEEQRRSALDKINELLQAQGGLIRPYFPLNRRGEWRLEYNAVDPMSGKVEYFVEYFTSQSQAKRAQAEVTAYNKKSKSTDATLKEAPILSLAAAPRGMKNYPSASFVSNILETLKKNGITDSKVTNDILELSLDAMPERSFMQGFRKRKTTAEGQGVRGFIGDITPTTGISGQQFDFAEMIKSKGRDFSRQIVQLKSGAEIQGFLKQLEDGGYEQNPETRVIAQKLKGIAEFAQSPNVARWSQMATALGFNWTMGANFSSAAITFFDVGMSAMPILSGRFGFGATNAAYGRSMKLLLGAPKERTIEVTGPDGKPVKEVVQMGMQGKSIANYDFDSKDAPEGLTYMKYIVAGGLAKGQFNQSMTQEQLEIGRNAPLETINKYTSFMFHHSERINREATMVAAYDLKLSQLAKGRDLNKLKEEEYQEAVDFAIGETEFVLGSAASAGRPTFAQSNIGNILFLFKRFAISKYYMMGRMVSDSVANADPKERAIARKQFGMFLITTGLASGIGGMPLMGLFGAIYNMFSDEFEDDFESMLRKSVGGGYYDGFANELFGVDIASRVSMNSLLYRKPFIKKDQDPMWTLAEQLGGPVLGVILSTSRAIRTDVMQGEYRLAVEGIMPAAVRSFLKAERYGREGIQTRRGDPIVGDLNSANLITQALGFTPQTEDVPLAEIRKINNNERRKQNAINSKRQRLLRKLNIARREGDIDGMRDAMKQIREFNKRLPKTARKSVITTAGRNSTVAKSRKSFQRTTGDMTGGITYTPFMRASLKEYDIQIQ
jgi:copper chaperone CopZ